MDIAAVLVNGPEPFEQIGNTLSTEGPVWNLVKIAQAVSVLKTFKNYTILYMFITQGQGQITLGDKILIIAKMIYYFKHAW